MDKHFYVIGDQNGIYKYIFITFQKSIKIEVNQESFFKQKNTDYS